MSEHEFVLKVKAFFSEDGRRKLYLDNHLNDALVSATTIQFMLRLIRELDAGKETGA